MPQYPKGATGMGPPWEYTEEVGGGPHCVGYLLQSGGLGSSALWVRNMGALGGDGQESGGSPCGIPPEGYGEDSAAAVGWDMEEGGGGECSRGKRDTDFGGVYRPSADHSGVVGSVAANI